MPSKERFVTVVDLTSDDDIPSKVPTSDLINTELLPKKTEVPKAVLVESDSKSLSPQPTPAASPVKVSKQRTLQSFFLKGPSEKKLKATPLPKRKLKKDVVSQEIKDIVLLHNDLSSTLEPINNGNSIVQTTQVILPEVVCGSRRRTNRIVTVERVPLTNPPSLPTKEKKDSLLIAKADTPNAGKNLDKAIIETDGSNLSKHEVSSQKSSSSDTIPSNSSTAKDIIDSNSNARNFQCPNKTIEATEKSASKSAASNNFQDFKSSKQTQKKINIASKTTVIKSAVEEENVICEPTNSNSKLNSVKPKCQGKKIETKGENSAQNKQKKDQPTINSLATGCDVNFLHTSLEKKPSQGDKTYIETSTINLGNQEQKKQQVHILFARKKRKLNEPSKSSTSSTAGASLINEVKNIKTVTHTKESRTTDASRKLSNVKTETIIVSGTPIKNNQSLVKVKNMKHTKTTKNIIKSTKMTNNEQITKSSSSMTKPPNAPQKKKAPSIDTSTTLATDGLSTNDSANVISEISLPDWYLEKHFFKHETLRKKYEKRAVTLEQLKIVEEQTHDNLDTTKLSFQSSAKDGREQIFPDNLVSELADLVQGSSLPLSSLGAQVAMKSVNISKISMETVVGKIKLIAQRKSYLRACPSADRFENNDPRSMWRWEVISDSFLTNVNVAKKARSSRRKLMHQYRGIGRLLQAMKDADSAATSPKIQKLLAKVSEEEEKVLKFEREEEKARLLKEEKRRKEQERINERRIKEEEKRRREVEKQQKKEEERKIKEKEKRERDEEKRIAKELERSKKVEEKEKRRKEDEINKEQKRLEKERAAQKQKARMMSFFKAPISNPETILNAEIDNVSGSSNNDHKTTQNSSKRDGHPPSIDSDLFWGRINGGIKPEDDFNLTNKTIKTKNSNQRKCSTVCVRVFVTVVPENIFEQKPYAEERLIRVKNKYKFLSFYEDYRPAYRGTWSKPRSSLVSGRNPFGKDTQYLDYDVDSEAEWEDGDDDQGEDCEDCIDDDEKFDDEEGDTRMYNYQDGWLAADDELGYVFKDDDDEETRALRKRRIEAIESTNGLPTNNLCVIAPRMGGLPQYNDENECPELVEESVEGVSMVEAGNILTTHNSEIVGANISNCLAVLPPIDEPDKKESGISLGGGTINNANKSLSDEMTEENMKLFAMFVHLCKLPSKEKLVEELRTTHKHLISSRAQALRKLDFIATKRRLPNGAGVIWEVKDKILKSLGLEDLIKPIQVTGDDLIRSPSMKKKRKKETNRNTKTSSPKERKNPVPVTPIDEKKSKDLKSAPRKRKAYDASTASINLLASFLKRKV